MFSSMPTKAGADKKPVSIAKSFDPGMMPIVSIPITQAQMLVVLLFLQATPSTYKYLHVYRYWCIVSMKYWL